MSFRRSLRLRLSLAATFAIAAALAVSGVVLSAMFDRQVNRLAEIDLAERAVILISGLRLNTPPEAPADTIGGDPRYLRPFSGQYWQIDIVGRSYRSQSLWDAVLPLGPRPAPGESRITTGPGPDGQALLILDRLILVGAARVPVRVSVALDRRSFTEAQSLFARDLVPFLAVLGGLLIVTSFIQVAVGLRPFRRIRHQVARLGTGDMPRLGRDMPQEVQPLAQEIDDLLDERDARIEKARNRAADLAHTLKTPLQALLGEAGRLRAAGQSVPALAIEQIVETIRLRIDHELGRDRIAGQGTSHPERIARGVADVLRRTARGGAVEILVAVEPRPIRVDPQDLAEALGSLAENALRHARSRIAIRSEAAGPMLALIVEDDGPGIPESQMDFVTARGVSLSHDPEGDGLGLALAQEIVSTNGGMLVFENRAGGLCVTMTFPMAQPIV